MEESKKKMIDGISVSLSFLITSIILYLYPEFVGSQIVTSSIGVFLGIMGILFFLVQVSSLELGVDKKGFKDALNDIFVALFMAVIIFTLLLFFNNWLVHLIVLFMMLLTFFGFLRGLFTILSLIDYSKKSFISKLPMIILNLAIFTLTILQLLQIFKVIDG
ncbi:hypothetical protein [Gracilibacillus dipsosauri]|uniref:hypothetical protein n=1 Tax=Gracilibacillus dipsosauri TaxID=178340 RepID=UPI0024091181